MRTVTKREKRYECKAELCFLWKVWENPNWKLTKLCKELDRLWVEYKGSEILFIWTQFLKEECLNFLGISDKLDVSAKYTRELDQAKSSKLTERTASADSLKEAIDKDVTESVKNNNNNKTSSVTINCDIDKRLPLHRVDVDSNTIVDKSDNDSVCSSVKSEANDDVDDNKSKNSKLYVNNRKWYTDRYFNEKHNGRYKNTESEHVYHPDSGRKQRYEKRRSPLYNKKNENNESFDKSESNSNVNSSGSGRNDYNRRFPFDKRRSNVTAKSFNADTNKWEVVSWETVSSSSSSSLDQIKQNSLETRKSAYCDKHRKHRNDSVVTKNQNDNSNDDSMSPNTKTYNSFEFVNSKYRQYHRPYKRYKTHMSKPVDKSMLGEDCHQNMKENDKKEVVENKNDRFDSRENRNSGFNVESQMSVWSSPLAVNNVTSSSSTTKVINNCVSDKQSGNKLSSSQLSVNTSDCSTCDCAVPKVHGSDVVVSSKTSSLHRNGLRREHHEKRIRRPKQHKKHLHEVIEDYDRERSKTEFGRNIFTCNICFANKLGIKCTQFKPCDHVFCRECISGYIEVKIKEGTVQSINCPEHKCESEALPSQIRELVSPELFARYDHLLLASTLDTMGDIVYCPRSSCQYPVSKEEDEKMAMCPACKYVFCIYCKMVYHGVEPCRLKNEDKLALIKEYQNADRQTKLILEQRYGKSLLTSLVENHMSETWISNNSKTCPSCNTAIEKSDGCNKMVCWKCNTFFCWLCGARLDALTPYKHYYDTKSKCNNRLFEGIIVDGNDSDNEEIHDDLPFDDEIEPVPFEMGYNMFVINLNLDPELENHLLVRIDNVD